MDSSGDEGGRGADDTLEPPRQICDGSDAANTDSAPVVARGAADDAAGASDDAAGASDDDGAELLVPASLGSGSTGAGCLSRMKSLAISCYRKAISSNPTHWLFLAVLGVLCALVGYLVERATMSLSLVREALTDTGNYVGGWATWTLVSIAFLVMSTGVTHLLQPNAAGSGIPEMKSILAGVVLSRYLTLRTLAAKFIGLVFSLASAVSIGREGPFVHMAAIIATQLTRVPFFASIRQNPFLARQMQAVAVAVGVATCFGAPVGGVLFAIEVTSTIFMVSNLWKCFFCSAWSIVMFRTLHEIAAIATYDYTDLDETKFGPTLLLFATLGVLCGAAAGFFIFLYTLWVRVLERFDLQSASRRYLLAVMVAGAIGGLGYPITSLRLTDRQVGNEMFDNKELSAGHWTWGSVYLNLVVYFFGKILLTSLSICLPVPCGCLTPLFTSGAVLGRFFGEVLHAMGPELRFEPGVYAMVGAAALCSGVTRSLSVVIIIFEITGELHNMLGVLVASLFAYAVAGYLYPGSIYDIILGCRGLDHLPVLNARAKIAAELMQVDFGYIHLKSTYRDLDHALQHFNYTEFPLVESDQTLKLIGTLPRAVLCRCMFRHMCRLAAARGGPSGLPPEALARYEQYEVWAARGGTDAAKGHMVAWWDNVYAHLNNTTGRGVGARGARSGGGGAAGGSGRSHGRRRGRSDGAGAYAKLVQMVDIDEDDNGGDSADRDGSRPRAPRGEATSLVSIVRARGGDIRGLGDDAKARRKSQSMSMVLEAARQRDAESKGWAEALSPVSESGARKSFRSDSDVDEKVRVVVDERADGSDASSVRSINQQAPDPSDALEVWMDQPIAFMRVDTMAIDHGPICLREDTPIQRVAFLMSVVGLNQVLVVTQGNLLGVIGKSDLFHAQ